VLGDADRIEIGDFGHGDATVDRGLKIDMVGADASRQGEIQFLALVMCSAVR
jgi:hypothetical protein